MYKMKVFKNHFDCWVQKKLDGNKSVKEPNVITWARGNRVQTRVMAAGQFGGCILEVQLTGQTDEVILTDWEKGDDHCFWLSNG